MSSTMLAHTCMVLFGSSIPRSARAGAGGGGCRKMSPERVAGGGARRRDRLPHRVGQRRLELADSRVHLLGISADPREVEGNEKRNAPPQKGVLRQIVGPRERID